MEAIIKIKPAELTQALLDRISQLIGNSDEYEIELHVKNVNSDFYQKLDASLQQARDGKIIRFTSEELDKYTAGKLG